LAVPWDLQLPQAILRILRHGFQHFLDNYPAVTLAGEPEGIHQMRVAMRRLLSAIRMFGPVLRLEDARELFQALKTLFSQLGGVREAGSSGSRFRRWPRQASGQRLSRFSAEKLRPFAVPPIRGPLTN
jgi:inorganic triphosphatase YgiF